jgi:uncharacterized membrane protein YoaK (UPF0700 family)
VCAQISEQSVLSGQREYQALPSCSLSYVCILTRCRADAAETMGSNTRRADKKPNPMVSLTLGERTAANAVVPFAASSLVTRLLPGVLSVIAGSVDVISFLGLGGLFTAHITGNLVVLAAHIVTGKAVPLAPILAVPVFIAVLGLTRLAAAGLEEARHATLRPLLALQFVLLVSFLAVAVAAGPFRDPDSPMAVVAGMLGVAAMAVQNALVQISLVGAPATAVMTTDITKFTTDVVAILFRRDPNGVACARTRAGRTWPAILGFTVGCSLGAVLNAAIGLWSLALPAGFALLALTLARITRLHLRSHL